MLLILFSPHTLRPSALGLPERRLCITALSLLASLPAWLFLCMGGGEIAKMECLGRNLFVWNKKERDGCFWPESSGGVRWKTALVCHIGGQGGQDVEWLGAAGSLGWEPRDRAREEFRAGGKVSPPCPSVPTLPYLNLTSHRIFKVINTSQVSGSTPALSPGINSLHLHSSHPRQVLVASL